MPPRNHGRERSSPQCATRAPGHGPGSRAGAGLAVTSFGQESGGVARVRGRCGRRACGSAGRFRAAQHAAASARSWVATSSAHGRAGGAAPSGRRAADTSSRWAVGSSASTRLDPGPADADQPARDGDSAQLAGAAVDQAGGRPVRHVALPGRRPRSSSTGRARHRRTAASPRARSPREHGCGKMQRPRAARPATGPRRRTRSPFPAGRAPRSSVVFPVPLAPSSTGPAPGSAPGPGAQDRFAAARVADRQVPDSSTLPRLGRGFAAASAGPVPPSINSSLRARASTPSSEEWKAAAELAQRQVGTRVPGSAQSARPRAHVSVDKPHAMKTATTATEIVAISSSARPERKAVRSVFMLSAVALGYLGEGAALALGPAQPDQRG